jgi:two-component system cell cycle sensor histidine kinase/response regulator CckA
MSTRNLTVLLLGNPEALARVRVALAPVALAAIRAHNSPGEALADLTSAAPDVMVLDLELGGTVGLSALGALRQAAPQVPIVALAAPSDEELGLAALHAGAQDLLVNDLHTARDIRRTIIRAALHGLERSRAEESLRRSHTLLCAVIDGISDAVFAKDRWGRYLLFNRAAERLTGKPAAEVLGRDDTALFEPESARLVMERDRRVLAAGREETEEEVLSAGGVTRTYLATKAPLRSDQGQIVGLFGISRDITEQKSIERQLQEAQKLEAVGTLAAGIAHDSNNILSVVLGYSELGLSQLGSDDPIRRMLAEIHQAALRGTALTRQLLAFTRQQVVEPTVLSLNEVLSGFEPMLRRLIGEDVLLATRYDPDLGSVRMDAGQMEQVVMNLAVNARDAMPQGGHLTIETRNVELDESYTQVHPGVARGRYAALTVTDTGTGMSADIQARIFDPFFTTKERGRGTGLGLAVVHGIVRQHRGHVQVFSELGGGTSFRLCFPVVGSPAAAAAPGPSRAGELPHGRETILVAEDEAALRPLLRSILGGCGYTVLEASDGEEALRIAGEYDGPIHLMISDVVMPHLGGRELARRMQALRPAMPVLFMSGYADDAVVRHGVLDAEFPFLQKPFSPSALARKVREVLDQQNAGTPSPSFPRRQADEFP